MKLLIYGTAIFLGTFVGGLIPAHFSRISERNLQWGVALGAGLLLGMNLGHMIPEAASLLPASFGYWTLLGFLILLVVERFAMVHACDEKMCNYHTVGMAAFVGLTIHGLIEGGALASSLVVPSIGPLVLVAILSHKLPSGVALASILRLAGMSKTKSLAFLTGVSISGPLGLVVSYLLLSHSTLAATAGVLLSVSAGTFVYIGACDLLPEMHRAGEARGIRLLCFLIGVVLSLLGGLVV